MKPFKWLSISDIHFGARSTTAEELIAELDAFFEGFSSKSALKDIDLLTFAGDVWDNTIAFSSEVLPAVVPWFFRLLDWCGRYGIVVRFLEGTPKHDRRQTETLLKIAQHFAEKVDVKYISTLSIEQHEKLGLSILYVPDECRPTAKEVERDVQKLLDEHHLDSVDIGVMHGMFKYQLGLIPMDAKVHDEAWYLERVKAYISIGHIHVASQYSHIVAQGSFGRLSHGEEQPKGAVLIQRLDNGEWMHRFLVNTKAKLYITIPVKGTIDQAFATIEKRLQDLPTGSYVRILAHPEHPILQGFETLIRKFPGYVFSKKKEKETVKVIDEPDVFRYQPIVLNEQTLHEALMTEVLSRHALETADEIRLNALLRELQS